MIKTVKLHANKNEIFQKKNAESKETKAASLIKNKNCNFSTNSQHKDDTVVGNENIVSRDDEIHFIKKNCGGGNCYDKIGNEENQENMENSYVFGFFIYFFKITVKVNSNG